METKLNVKNCGSNDDEPNCLNYSSMVHSKKVVKHALRQQVKRRRKNTTIAAGSSRSLPRIVHTLPSTVPNDISVTGIGNQQSSHIAVEETAATMKEVLASLPGFSIKSNRRRSAKRLSVAAQLEAGLVDLESPASILANTSLRALLNRHTFQGLPPLYQRKLAQLLPTVDRQDAATSGLNNEFFARACQEWRKRLAEGEFTPENQQRLKMEAEKDKNKLDPWKVKHFEPIWGEKRETHKLRSGLHCMNKDQMYTKTITRSNLRSQTESSINSISSDRQSPNMSLMEDKVDQTRPSLTNDVTDETSVSVKDQRIVPEFNVTVRILEDDEEDDENDDEDEDEEDEEEDDEDEEEDEDEEDDEEDEDEEDEDEEDEVETQVSLTYLDEEAQHCRAIIVASTSNEELYNQQKISNEIPVTEQAKYSKEMLLDFINDRNFVDVDMKVKEEKHDIHRRSIERSLKSSMKEFKYLSRTSIENITEKDTECLLENEDQVIKLSEEDLQVDSNIELYTDSDSKLKFTVKDETFGDDIGVEIKSPDKEELFQNTDLCCQENDQITCEDANNVTTEIAGVIEIDNETLQRIHELEVRGEMQEAYEEISGCPEEIMYPILEDIEINSSNTKISDSATETIGNEEINGNVSTRMQDEAFQEANNYVCSEMLDCSWTSNTSENTVTNDREELQVPWPLVAAALDNTEEPSNVTIATSNDCNESQSFTDKKISQQEDELVNDIEENSESVNCIQLPVTPFHSEGLRIAAPVTSCLMKNVHTTQSSSIITFPQLQSIRFVQTNFQTTIEHSTSETMSNTTSLCAQIQSPTDMPQQSPSNINDSAVLCRNQKNVINQEVEAENEFQSGMQNVPPGNSTQQQNMQSQSTVVLQQQTLLPLSSRQIITALPQQQSHYPMIVNVQSKANRSIGIQNTLRSSRNSNREHNNGRSRNVTKEPPGAVNLERSYQICQAVIASSPNRDQLKAHLKPPPSLLTRSDKSLSNNKFGVRSGSSNKIQKNCQSNQGGSVHNKSQGVMLKHVFAASRQHYSGEVAENNTVNQIGCSNPSGIGQYILVKRTGTSDSAPRASSAPPMPPQIAGMSIGVHIVRGRPASAGEGSQQAVALKTKGTNYRDNGGAEPEAPSIIVGGNPPSPCECSIQGAMVICRQCGAFCHDNCISPQCICAVCLIP